MADPPVKPIRVLDLAGLAAPPRPEYLVHRVLPAQAAAMLCGAYGTAKTYLALDLGLSIASGCGTWFGRPTKGGRVVYIAAEAAFSLQRRVDAWLRVNRGRAPALYVVPDAVQLMDTKDLARLVTAIAATAGKELALIVLDTWQKCAPGADENSVADMGLALASVDVLRQRFGATVLLLHHTPHDKNRPRGSTALIAAMDTALLAVAKDGHRELRCLKQRHDEEFRPLGFRLVPVHSSCVVEPTQAGTLTESEKKVLAALPESGTVSLTFWQSAAQVPERTFFRAKQALISKGLVTPNGSHSEVIAGMEEVPVSCCHRPLV